MAECSQQVPYTFSELYRLEVKFTSLSLSGDAGVLLARQAEAQVGICQGMAAVMTDPRNPHRIHHTLHQLISQRVYQILAGYEDVNDSNELRHDPIFKMACGCVSS